MESLVASTSGDIKEARDRHEAAEAYRLERFTKKLNGDKEAAKKYLKIRDSGQLKR